MTTIEDIKKAITPIASELGLKRVILFGSYARGEQTKDSDIDLIIDSEETLRGLQVFGAIYKISEVLPVKADIFELYEIIKPSQTYDAIMQEGVLVYER